MDNSIKNTGNGLYPSLPPQDMSNQEPISRMSIGNTNFGAYVTSQERHVPTQTSPNSGNSPCDINTALKSRKAEVTKLQETSLQKYGYSGLSLMPHGFVLGAFLVASILISPLFTIAIALVVISLIILIVKQANHSTNAENYGIEKFCIAMLLKGLKDKTPTANTSAEDNTELLNVLEKVVISARKQGVKLIDYVLLRRFNPKYQDEKSQQELRNQVDEFFDLIFKNAELTACLEKLGFEAKAVQESIHTYVENSPLDKLHKIILE